MSADILSGKRLNEELIELQVESVGRKPRIMWRPQVGIGPNNGNSVD